MLTHIVLFKLKDRSPESIEVTRKVLADMEGKIPQLLHIEVGVDVVHSERSYDIALVTKFNSRADLDAYQIHPIHQGVIQHIGSVREAVISVDYET